VLLVGTDQEIRASVRRWLGALASRFCEDSEEGTVEPLAPLPYALVSLANGRHQPSRDISDRRSRRTHDLVRESLAVGMVDRFVASAGEQ